MKMLVLVRILFNDLIISFCLVEDSGDYLINNLKLICESIYGFQVYALVTVKFEHFRLFFTALAYHNILYLY